MITEYGCWTEIVWEVWEYNIDHYLWVNIKIYFPDVSHVLNIYRLEVEHEHFMLLLLLISIFWYQYYWLFQTQLSIIYLVFWLYSITNIIWTAITDKKYIESNAACWSQHLSDIWGIGIKLSVIVDTYTQGIYTDYVTKVCLIGVNTQWLCDGWR